MVHMSRSRIASGPVHTHTASATDLPSALAILQRLALGSGDGWRRLVVDLPAPLDPIHEICGRALGRRVAFQSRSGRTIAGVDAALRGDWIDDITLSALRGLMPEAAVLAWSRFDPAVESSSGWMPFGRRGWILPRLQLEADEGCHRLVGYLLPGERPEAIEPARASLLVPRRAPVTARMYRQEEDSDFRDLVHGAIEAIQSGDLEKVVLGPPRSVTPSRSQSMRRTCCTNLLPETTTHFWWNLESMHSWGPARSGCHAESGSVCKPKCWPELCGPARPTRPCNFWRAAKTATNTTWWCGR